MRHARGLVARFSAFSRWHWKEMTLNPAEIPILHPQNLKSVVRCRPFWISHVLLFLNARYIDTCGIRVHAGRPLTPNPQNRRPRHSFDPIHEGAELLVLGVLKFFCAPTRRGRGLSKLVISRVKIRVTPLRALITLLITYLLSPLPLQADPKAPKPRNPQSPLGWPQG